MVELVATTSILLLAAGMATYSLQGFMRSYRAQSDARSIASQVSLARMRAASAFRDTRIVFNQANRTYQMQVMVDRVAGTWTNEGGTYFLSSDVVFGTGGVTMPAGEQTTMQQSQNVQFNTRSIPVNGTDPTPEYAVYLTNNSGLTYAITVSQTGRVNTWEWVQSTWQLR